eukprot:SAG25_NODE_81_length_16694_cov_8.663332_6_plen_81_part_00
MTQYGWIPFPMFLVYLRRHISQYPYRHRSTQAILSQSRVLMIVKFMTRRRYSFECQSSRWLPNAASTVGCRPPPSPFIFS